MKKIILALILLTQSTLLLAEPVFSRELITSFYTISNKLDTVAVKYPKAFQGMDDFTLQENDKLIKYVKSTQAYPEIRSILSASGFSSIDDFFNFSYRILGSMYAVQMQKMTAEEKRQLDAIGGMFDGRIKMMEQNGAPASKIVSMKAQQKEMQAQQVAMQQAAKNASKADIKFASDNFNWLVSNMPEEEENSEEHPGE